VGNEIAKKLLLRAAISCVFCAGKTPAAFLVEC